MLDMNALRDWRISVDMQGIAWAVFDREGDHKSCSAELVRGNFH